LSEVLELAEVGLDQRIVDGRGEAEDALAVVSKEDVSLVVSVRGKRV